METVRFLREHGLDAIVEKFSLLNKRHTRYPNLVLLKYNQIESPMGERISQECRALIIDEENNWAPVSVPYFKFFNYGEGHAPEIDWTTAKVFEKLDGSLITLYHYRGEWHVSTSGSPDASGPTMANGPTFAELFWRVWHDLSYATPADTSLCYMFELMTPLNRIVVARTSSNIVLHGARRIATLEEIRPEDANAGWRVVKQYAMGTIGDVVASAVELNPMETEGYVVCDARFNRIKVKSPQYVAIHHLRDSLSVRRMIDIVRTNEGNEFLNYFPEFEPLYREVKQRYDNLVAETERTYQEYKNIPVQKDFALAIQHYPFKSAMFSVRNGRAESFQQHFAGLSMKSLENLLKSEEIDATILMSLLDDNEEVS